MVSLPSDSLGNRLIGNGFYTWAAVYKRALSTCGIVCFEHFLRLHDSGGLLQLLAQLQHNLRET